MGKTSSLRAFPPPTQEEAGPANPAPLLGIFRREAEEAGGCLPFRRFMELALYHPDHGYYSSGCARLGKSGDFFTNVSVGRIYGRLLASVCCEAWERLGCPSPFTVIEQGANEGMMAADLLAAVAEQGDAFTKALHYRIVEPFPVNQRRQREKLSTATGVSWHASMEEIPEFTGVHLSNELLDAFPVDSLRWNGDAWEEECVTVAGGWTTRPIKDPSLLEEAKCLPVPPRLGWRFEINRGITPWLEGIASRMTGGLILTIDYGQVGEDRFAPHRADGTLLAYRHHQRFDDPLPEPGLRDITAQVDFTDLAAKAVRAGFTPIGYSSQHHFLVGAAEPWMRSLGVTTSEYQKDLRALNTLLSPSLLGSQFKALALGKNFPLEPTLGCFRYQRPGISAL